MTNRLADEKSPYLLQHKDNPIDWYPWGDEAFRRAQEEDKPVFLSVGYSSCHWCHVMAHESFEDESVAEVLNKEFISIKLDREERPDIDEIYMTAVQLATGHGGWPMSVFLTSEKKPFFAGTYFPKETRGDFPSFLSLAITLARAWHENRDEVLRTAEDFAKGLDQALTQSVASYSGLSLDLVHHTFRVLEGSFDPEHGGFGGAPKFPPHSALEFLREFSGVTSIEEPQRQKALEMALFTLKKMALGGIHDHVGGGFHRYSTDNRWLLPHFEKMLYDNAQLLGMYEWASHQAGEDRLKKLFQEAANDIALWLQQDMRSEDGLFYSALDADSEGEEGLYYLWGMEEIEAVLGERAQAFAQTYGLQSEGNYRDEAKGTLTGLNILHRQSESTDSFTEELRQLSQVRKQRTSPALDDKAICAWNGLAIEAFASSGLESVAEVCARTWLAAEERFGQLPHQVIKGEPGGTAFLDDYACFIHGLLALHDVRPAEEVWLQQAKRLGKKMIDLFWDPIAGGFFYTSSHHEFLFARTKPAMDRAEPSPNGIAALCLLKLGFREKAEQTLRAFQGWMEHAPHACETLIRAFLIWYESGGSDLSVAPPQMAAVKPIATIEAALESSELTPEEDGYAYTELRIAIPPGMHLNSSDPMLKWLVPTRLEARGVICEASYPEGENDRYEGEISIPIRVLAPAKTTEFELALSFQSCSERECYAPEEKIFTGVIKV